MEINLNSGSVKWSEGQMVEDVKSSDIKVASDTRKTTQVNFSTSTVDALNGSEPTADVPESALGRDDALGKLVNSAFNLAPPPPPKFD